MATQGFSSLSQFLMPLPLEHHGLNQTMLSLYLLSHQASLSMDEAARQTSSHSLSSASTSTAATMRRPGASQRQHRRTGSVGTVSEHEVN